MYRSESTHSLKAKVDSGTEQGVNMYISIGTRVYGASRRITFIKLAGVWHIVVPTCLHQFLDYQLQRCQAGGRTPQDRPSLLCCPTKIMAGKNFGDIIRWYTS
jgi:hypothetical protein